MYAQWTTMRYVHAFFSVENKMKCFIFKLEICQKGFWFLINLKKKFHSSSGVSI